MTALLNRKTFFDAVRPLFNGLSPQQVSGMETILDAVPPDTPRWHLAYCLATAFHETAATMLPIEEYGRGKGKAYASGGWWGRGYVQLTWEANYSKATKRLRELGYLTTSQSLVTNKALAMDPTIAAAIMFIGMREGWFTGKRLDQYFYGSHKDAKGARKIINGTDKDDLIASYFNVFDNALLKAGYHPSNTLDAVPTPPVEVSPVPPARDLDMVATIAKQQQAPTLPPVNYEPQHGMLSRFLRWIDDTYGDTPKRG